MKGQIVLFACFMLFFGSISTVSLKFQDLITVGTDADGSPKYFKHPALQSCFMFFGEALCLIPHFLFSQNGKGAAPNSLRRRRRPKGFRYEINKICAFAIPAMCDAAATTLLNIGLYYTYASTFQMLRGTLVLWAGMFTVFLIRRPLYIHHWMGMFFIASGAAIVGAASIIYKTPALGPPPQPPNSSHFLGAADVYAGVWSVWPWGSLLEPSSPGAMAPLFGDTMIFFAQIFAALQFILEERYLSKFRMEPLLAVGIEGIWGLALCTFALPLLTVVKGADGQPLDNGIEAVQQIAGNKQLQAAIVTCIMCIGVLNFFGLKVTKALSGASRATIDACRTLFVWMFSLAVGWEAFHGLQIVGFLVLVAGTSMYNEVIRPCLPLSPPAVEAESSSSESDDDESEEVEVDEQEARKALVLLGETEGQDPLRQPLLKAGSLPNPATHSMARKMALHVHLKNDESSDYTMARSWMLGPHALMPRPLDEDSESLCGQSPQSDNLTLISSQFSYLPSTSSFREEPSGLEPSCSQLPDDDSELGLP